MGNNDLMNTILTLEELLATPPAMAKGAVTLPDGRQCEIHELPCSVLEEVTRISKNALENNEDISIREVARIAAFAVLGREPKKTDINQMLEKFGPQMIGHLYQKALRFSQLGDEALSDAKKD